MSSTSFEARRAIHDDKHKNYYDYLQQNAQRERTRLNSAPTIRKYSDRGNIFHEPQIKTNKPVNFHSISLNHSTVPCNRKI